MQDLTMQFDQELTRRWNDFSKSEAVEARRLRRLQRLKELTRFGEYEALCRSSLEAFCEQRMLLPYDGLEYGGLADTLWAAGFYWRHPSAGRPQLMPVLFPEGWHFIPYELDANVLRENEGALYRASLRGPQGEWPADIEYTHDPNLNPAVEFGRARFYVK